jgi:hypothetical protein
MNGRRVYPRFQFATTEPATVHEIVLLVNERLGGHEDPLGVISWWLTPNTWLGQPPAQLLGVGHDAEIDYAADQLTNDSW